MCKLVYAIELFTGIIGGNTILRSDPTTGHRYAVLRADDESISFCHTDPDGAVTEMKWVGRYRVGYLPAEDV
jgi:hypothetical protein